MRLRPWLNSQHEMFDVLHSRATDRRSASKCQGKWPDQTLDQAFGLPELLVAVSTSRLSCKRAGKTRTLMPVWDSSGESRPKRCRTPLHDRTQPGMRFRRYFPHPHDGVCAHCGLVRQLRFSQGLLLEYSKPAAAGGPRAGPDLPEIRGRTL